MIGVHILKNILIPIVTVIGLELGSVIAFAIVTESIFAWPGTGKLLIDSINQLDRPVIVAYLLVIVTIFIVINFVVDVLYSVLDPRVRLGRRGRGALSHGRRRRPKTRAGRARPRRAPSRRGGASRREFAESRLALVGLALLLVDRRARARRAAASRRRIPTTSRSST